MPAPWNSSAADPGLLPGFNKDLRESASGSAAGTAPAVAAPGAAEQPAADEGGAGHGQPQLHQPAPLGAPAQLAILVALAAVIGAGASWLNQIEIYFSIVQRKVLIPNDLTDLAEVEQRLLGFQCRYEQTAVPFAWGSTRADLDRLIRRLDEPAQPIKAA